MSQIFVYLLFAAPFIFKDVSYELSKSGDLLKVKIISKVDGWVGFGVGTDMVGDIIICWKSRDSVVVSNRIGTGEDLPAHKSNPNLKTISSSVTSDGFVVEFTRDLEAINGFTTAVRSDFMAAYQPGAISSTDVTYSIAQHRSSTRTGFTYNIETGAGESTSSSNFQLYHGILMSWSWLVLLPASFLVARFGKKRLGAKWFVIHKGINGLVTFCTIAALILICLSKNNVIFTNSALINWHAGIGVSLFVFLFLQIFLGVYIDKTWNPNRTEVPPGDKIHWTLGYILILLALINAILALIMSSDSGKYVYAALAILGAYIIVFAVLQYRFGQVHDN
eukprot:NODE_425_length_8856_cov_0.734841.p3 type:complete len:335 gc:universal NODE_425_length_8856_cov_0.734841:4093-5097(+)